MKSKKKYYAVKIGRTKGIFEDWESCKKQVLSYPGAVYKSFLKESDALNYLNGCGQDKMSGDDEKNTELYSDEERLVAYVDGSYSDKCGLYSSAAVYVFKDGFDIEKRAFKNKDMISMRNVAGEIEAAKMAVEYAYRKGYKKIAIHYDYEGIRSWALAYWSTNRKGSKEYKDFIDSYKDKIDVQFIKVQAHSNDKYNDLADKAAKEALNEYFS